jgi:hypothetical protein
MDLAGSEKSEFTRLAKITILKENRHRRMHPKVAVYFRDIVARAPK